MKTLKVKNIWKERIEDLKKETGCKTDSEILEYMHGTIE